MYHLCKRMYTMRHGGYGRTPLSTGVRSHCVLAEATLRLSARVRCIYTNFQCPQISLKFGWMEARLSQAAEPVVDTCSFFSVCRSRKEAHCTWRRQELPSDSKKSPKVYYIHDCPVYSSGRYAEMGAVQPAGSSGLVISPPNICYMINI